MLESLITSRTRLKMLLKFFINSNATAYLRGMAEEFGESTNAIRHELNNLARASYIIAKEDGRTIQYRANTKHPLYPEIKNLIHKYLGLDKIVDQILMKLGKVYYAFVVGDYANGSDSGIIDLVIIGNINDVYLKRYVNKAEKLISRKIRVQVMDLETFRGNRKAMKLDTALLLWQEK